MNFVMNHTPGAVSIDRPFDLQSCELQLCYGYLQYFRERDRDRERERERENFPRKQALYMCIVISVKALF